MCDYLDESYFSDSFYRKSNAGKIKDLKELYEEVRVRIGEFPEDINWEKDPFDDLAIWAESVHMWVSNLEHVAYEVFQNDQS